MSLSWLPRGMALRLNTWKYLSIDSNASRVIRPATFDVAIKKPRRQYCLTSPQTSRPKKHKQPQVVGHVRQVTPVPLVRQGDVEFLTAVPGIVVGFVHKIFQEFPCEEQLDET